MSASKEIETLKRDKSKALNSNNLREAANICNYLGSKYSEQENYLEAIEEHKEELDLCEKLKDRLGTAVAHRRLGECLSMVNSFGTAINHLKKYLKIAVELNDKPEIQRAETTFGRTYWLHYNADQKKHKQSLKTAESHYKNALAWAEKLKGGLKEVEYAQMKCRALLNLALVYEQKNDDSNSVTFFKNATELAKKYRFKDDILRCELAWANYCQKIGSYLQARKLFNDAIETAKDLKDKISQCDALLSKAYVLINLNDNDGARHLFKKAYHLKTIEEEQRSKAKTGCKIMKKVIETLREINATTDLDFHCQQYDKLGDKFVSLGCYAVAIGYYSRQLECALKLGKGPNDLAVIYVSIGQTYLDNNQLEEALETFSKELECRAGNIEEEVKSLLKIIEVKIQLGRSYEEIEREYEYTLSKCDCNKLKKAVLKDFKYYLEQEVKDSPKKNDIEKQYLELGGDEEENEDEADAEEEEDPDADESGSEVSALTDDSDTEKNEEVYTGKAVGTRQGKKLKLNEKGETPLHRACIDGNFSMVRRLIDNKHPINPRDYAGWLPIHEAANTGSVEIVQYLIEHGAKINDRGCNDTTPLHDACINGHSGVIRLLMSHGANVIARDASGKVPLDYLKERLVGAKLTPEEAKDASMLLADMKARMKKAGFDFNAKRPPSATKRPHSPPKQGEEKKPINNFRSRRNRSPSCSPPRKISSRQKPKRDDALDAKKEYKAVMSSLRRPHDKPGPAPSSKPKIPALISEEQNVTDDWLELDVGPNLLKDRPKFDPFAPRNRDSTESTIPRPRHKNPSRQNRNVRFEDQRQEDERDSEGVEEIEELYEEEEFGHGSQEERQQDPILEDDENEEVFEIPHNNRPQANLDSNRNRSRVTNENPNSVFNNSSEGPNSPPAPSLSSPASSPPLPHLVPQPAPNQSNEKFLVNVHIDGKKFLLPVPSKSTTVSWLAEQTVNRYYQLRQMKPVLSLTTKDGALLGLDDLIIDVALDNEVYATIDSWALDPLPDRYESQCKLKKIPPNLDLKFRLKLAETSGKLHLSNVFISRSNLISLLMALRCQKSLRVLDFAFSNIVLFETDELIGQILHTLADLEVINFQGIGLDRSKMYLFTKHILSNVIDVNLSYNQLEDNCFPILLEMIKVCPSLKQLDLRFNNFTTEVFERSEFLALITERSLNIVK